jgi:hypothetical protein
VSGASAQRLRWQTRILASCNIGKPRKAIKTHAIVSQKAIPAATCAVTGTAGPPDAAPFDREVGVPEVLKMKYQPTTALRAAMPAIAKALRLTMKPSLIAVIRWVGG